MHKDLINAYAHGNLQEALLVRLYVEILKVKFKNHNHNGVEANDNVSGQLKILQAKVQGFLRQATYPQDELDAEQIRQSAIHLAETFFQDVRDILLPEDEPNEFE